MRRHGRRIRWLVVVMLVIVVAFTSHPSAVRSATDLLIFTDDYVNTSYMDPDRSTAAVDTTVPGNVQLPGLLFTKAALRPGKYDLLVVAEDQGIVQGYSFTGTSMKQSAIEVTFPGVLSAAWSTDGGEFFLASGSEVRVYGLNDAGAAVELVPLRLTGLSGAKQVVGGPGKDFWLLTGQSARYYAYSGTGYREYPALDLTLSNAKEASYDFDRRTLYVLDGDTVRAFAMDGSEYREVPDFEATAAGARSVAAARSGYRVLTDSSVIFFGYQADHVSRFPPLEDSISGAFLASSPWGLVDYALVTPQGVKYRGFTGFGYRTVEGLTAWSSVSGGKFSPYAVFVSTPIPSLVPIGRVRLEMTASTPPGTAVGVDVSTDHGADWFPVAPDMNTDLPLGVDIMYRLSLYTSDISITPKVDRVKILQIIYETIPLNAVQGSGHGHVRLTK